jgi:hypothetical protein
MLQHGCHVLHDVQQTPILGRLLVRGREGAHPPGLIWLDRAKVNHKRVQVNGLSRKPNVEIGIVLVIPARIREAQPCLQGVHELAGRRHGGRLRDKAQGKAVGRG